MPNSGDDVRILDHRIRETESALNIAKGRRKWSNISLVFGPLLLLILYVIWWIPWIGDTVRRAIYLPAVPVAVLFGLAAAWLKLRRGYPAKDGNVARLDGNGSRIYRSESELELELAGLRDERKHLLADSGTSPKVRRIGYKDDAYRDIDQMRVESGRYRSVNNLLQGVLIIGALAATGVSGLVGELPYLRWVALGLTFAVGIASGFMGYFKYKERSFYLQQTADAIENEWDAVEIGVGRYKQYGDDENAALAEFVEEVHRLKSEQKKRQQNLEQPPDTRSANE